MHIKRTSFDTSKTLRTATRRHCFSVDGLAEFFDYAAVDYVYLCGGYLKPGTEAWKFVVSMIEQGYLTDILYENGHGLACYTPEPKVPGDPEALVREFAQCYWAGDQQ